MPASGRAGLGGELFLRHVDSDIHGSFKTGGADDYFASGSYGDKKLWAATSGHFHRTASIDSASLLEEGLVIDGSPPDYAKAPSRVTAAAAVASTSAAASTSQGDISAIAAAPVSRRVESKSSEAVAASSRAGSMSTAPPRRKKRAGLEAKSFVGDLS